MDHGMGGPRFAPGDGNGQPQGNGDEQARERPDSAAAAGTTAEKKEDGGEEKKFRDRLGRFQVDNPGGPGNPFGRHVARNRQLLLAYFSEEKLFALFGKLEAMAMAGNVGAHKVLLQYLVGKPVPVPNPDRVNHDEWELRREQPHGEEVTGHMQSQLPHGIVLKTQRVLDIAKQAAYADMMRGANEAAEIDAQKRLAREERRARRKEERRRRRNGG